MTLTFLPDGTASCLYSDLIPLTELGPLRIQRASWIEFNEPSQEWEVRLAGPHKSMIDSIKPSFSNPSREACLAWEHQQLDQ